MWEVMSSDGGYSIEVGIDCAKYSAAGRVGPISQNLGGGGTVGSAAGVTREPTRWGEVERVKTFLYVKRHT